MIRRLRKESATRYTVYSKSKSRRDWIKEGEFTSLKEAEREAQVASRNAYSAKIVDDTGAIISRYYDMFPVKERKSRNEDYSSSLGVDDIEDIIASGLDWTEEDPLDTPERKRFYDDASKLITIAQAEQVIGKRPDATKPKAPTSKNPRPDTLRKYQADLDSYKDRVQALLQWEKKFERLVAIVQELKNLKDDLGDVRSDLAEWSSQNFGTYLVRDRLGVYSRVEFPEDVLDNMIESIGIPDMVQSLDGNGAWLDKEVDMDTDDDPFPSALITIGKKTARIIAVPSDIYTISNLIENQLDLSKLTSIGIIKKAKLSLDARTKKALDMIDTKKDKLTRDEEDLLLYLVSRAFLKEISNIAPYPSKTKVEGRTAKILDQC